MKKFLAIAITLGFLAACAPSPEVVTQEKISATDAFIVMENNNYYGGPFGEGELMLDKEYGLPTRKWIETYFYNEFWKQNDNHYQPESNDCDDFAGNARMFAQKLNNKTANKGLRALAFGEIHYVRDVDNQHHAINFAIIKENDKNNVVFFEPQTGYIVELSKKERESIYVWIM